MRATKLVCTLGPASQDRVPELLEAGMDVARINLTHQGPGVRDRLVTAVREASAASGRPVAVMADLPGPKVRLGELRGGQATLRQGARFVLRPDQGPGGDSGAATTYPGLGSDLEPGDRILLADGEVELRVNSAGDEVVTEVVRGGVVSSRAGVNVPSERLRLPAVTEKDRADAAWTASARIDLVAQSFVRRAEDVEDLRRLLGQPSPLVVAKIETRPAVEDVRRIAAAADAMIVARGDLGVEAELLEIPVLQRELVAAARSHRVPVMVATQMLESMVRDPEPTRAEVGDVAGAVFEGADGILLSAETAIGAHPVDAARTAGRIALIAETRGRRFVAQPSGPGTPPSDDAHATCEAAADVAREGVAVAVACFTRTGRTAALLSAARPGVPIVALSPDRSVVTRLPLFHGVVPRACRMPAGTDDMLAMLDSALLESACASSGDPAVLVASTPFGEAHTNLLKVHRVSG
jgi:pyruvate kinase